MSSFHGVFPYLVSPIGPDGRVLEAELRRLVELIGTVERGEREIGSALADELSKLAA